jgi:predicted dehydrogenase
MQWSYALYGEGGTLEMSWRLGEESVTFQGARRDEEPIRALTLPEHGFKESNVYSAFTEAIVEDRTLTPNFHDGLRVQEVIDAAIKADQQECAVSLQ